MEIYGPAHVHGAQPINPPHHARAARPSGKQGPIEDQVDISPEADLLSRARELPDVRMERVIEIRRQLAEGTYETPGKLAAAIDNLLDEIE